jgi:hypothetical protein
VANVLYYSTGSGVWWWNRGNNKTGIINTQGGIPLKAGNTNLPSNLATNMYIDRSQNKFYIGTHAGLFVWDRNDNTSKVYNTGNSLLTHNLINHIDKNEEKNLIYIACEYGGLLTINTITGEQKMFTKDSGNEVYPQLVDNNVSSGYYDKDEKKLYASAYAPNGGVWIKDYNNLIPDFGDLRLQNKSLAIDKADESVFPATITFDINGLNRSVNYTSIMGANSLDLGAYEKPFECPQPSLNIQFDKLARTYSFTPALTQLEESCKISYSWSFGDGTTSLESNPEHTYSSSGTFLVRLKLSYQCDACPAAELITDQQISIEKDLCETIYCHDNGGVSIGTEQIANGYKLSLKGKLIVTGARIALESTWPDFVFEKDYKLMSLQKLKKYIEFNGHLPNIPSAETIKQDGIDVGEMSSLMLQKTEELTLYLIELDERLKKLEAWKTQK